MFVFNPATRLFCPGILLSLKLKIKVIKENYKMNYRICNECILNIHIYDYHFSDPFFKAK